MAVKKAITIFAHARSLILFTPCNIDNLELEKLVNKK
jgi:hypothetical protein